MIRLFEAFSGYGSQALALKKYGVNFKSVGISEIDKYAIAAHKSLHGDIKNYGDVSKIDANELPDMDLFTYSFPCQDISNAGLQHGLEKGSGTRSSLLWECEKIIKAKRPKYLMMENVKNLVGKKNKPNFDKWLNILEELGYNNYWKVINAKWCGIPQNRERVFCVSILKEWDRWTFGTFHFQEDFDNGTRLKDVLEDKVDEKYYISDEKTKELIKMVKLETIVIDKSMIGFENKPREYTDYMPTITAREYKEPRLIKVLVKEATKKGYKEAYLGDSINLEQPNSKTRRGRVGNQVANTLTTSCNLATVEDSYRIRKLTPKECFRLMGVDDEDIAKIQATIINNKPISNSQQYKLAGNSIVVNCMKFLKNLE